MKEKKERKMKENVFFSKRNEKNEKKKNEMKRMK